MVQPRKGTMNERSVQAGDVRQSVVVTGDGNTVMLDLGDSGVSLPLRRKQFRPPSAAGQG